jgi:hypothetical protein
MEWKFRGFWPIAAIAAVIAGAGLLLYAVWRSPHRNDLIAYWGLVATVVTIAAGCISWLWRTQAGTSADAVDEAADDHLADVLARAVTGQWTRAAADRGLLVPEPIPVRWRQPSVPLAGPAAAATAARGFRPLPGMTLVTAAQLVEGDIGDLHQLYGGLGSGRLVIAGAPGSGKSGAAVLLILAALAHREQVAEADRRGVPVPVMFTLHGWDPIAQPVKDWLAARLGQTYPALAGPGGTAKSIRLLAAGRIAVVLDGLDEIPANLQPAALRALSQQATFRLVILTRTDEMAAAAARSHLDGAAAVELQAVDASTAARYLTSVQLDPPPPEWDELTRCLRRNPDSPLAQALGSPLTLALLRDTCRDRDDAREFLYFCDSPASVVSRDDIVDRLLDRVLPAAYARQPGQPPPRYDLQLAHRALSQVAAQMNREETRDLQWWNIPRWVTAAPRILIGVLTFALAVFLPQILTAPPATTGSPTTGDGILSGLWLGLAFGFVFGLAFWFAVVRRHKRPRRIRLKRWHELLRRDALGRGLVPGLVVGAGIEIMAWTAVGRLTSWLAAGPAAGLATALVFMFSGPGADDASSVVPIKSWRNDLAFGLGTGLLVGVVLGVVVPSGDFGVGFGYQLGIGLAAGLAAGIVFTLFSTRTWPASLAFVQLAFQWHTPPRLMRFLEDARQRNVLRIIGPVYQFRHARLQDHLAGQAYRSASRPEPLVAEGRNAP